MKSFRLFLVLLLLGNSTYPVIENITQAKDPQGEKTLVFLHDIHFEYLVGAVEHFLGAQGSEKLNAVVQEQNRIFQDQVLDILSGKNQTHQKTIFITETTLELFNDVIEKVFNPDKSAHFYEEELLWLVPHTFFSYAIKSEVDRDKRVSLLQNYLMKNVYSPDMSVLFAQPTPTFSWVIGDRLRSTTDTYISKLIPRDWQRMKPFLGENEILKPLTIKYIQNHIVDLQKFLDQKSISDDCCQKALNIINEVLAEEKIVATDHFVRLQEYLVETDRSSIQYELNRSIDRAVTKRFDAELLDYLEHLNEIDKDATSVVLLIGNTHAQNVLNILRQKGYQIEESLTTDNAQSMEEGFATVIANAQIVNKALQASSLF